MRVIGYTRVSTDGQAESGAGLDAQEVAIRAECKRRGWELIAIVTDTGSAKSMNGRPALADALDSLDAGRADALVAAKLDRLSRSVLDFASLMLRASRRSWSVVVLDVNVDTSTPSGELMATVVAAFAQYERKLIGQRTRDALAAKKASGIVLGRPLTLDSEIRARIVAERAAGRTLGAIAADLNVEGVATAHQGALWHPSTVKKVVDGASKSQPVEPVSLADDVRHRIASERADGRSLRAIAADLDAEGVPTARGGRWHASTVRAVVESLALNSHALSA